MTCPLIIDSVRDVQYFIVIENHTKHGELHTEKVWMTWRVNRLAGKGRMEKDDVNPSVFERSREKRGNSKGGMPIA